MQYYNIVLLMTRTRLLSNIEDWGDDLIVKTKWGKWLTRAKKKQNFTTS